MEPTALWAPGAWCPRGMLEASLAELSPQGKGLKYSYIDYRQPLLEHHWAAEEVGMRCVTSLALWNTGFRGEKQLSGEETQVLAVNVPLAFTEVAKTRDMRTLW